MYTNKKNSSLRGIGGNVLGFDEGGFINEKTIEIMMPLLNLAEVGFIVTSTIGEGDGVAFNNFLEDPEFQKYIKTYICDACRQIGLNDKACVHRKYDQPPWISRDNMDANKSLYNKNSEGYARETLGLVIHKVDPHAFRARKIDEWIASPRFSINRYYTYIYIVIDPCTGSLPTSATASEFTIVSMIDPCIYVGVDAVEARDHYVADEALLNHLKKLKSIEWFRDSQIVLDVESGLGFEPSRIQKLVRDNFKGIININTHDDKPGTITSAKSKQSMVKLMEYRLDEESAYFYEHFVSDTPHVMEKIRTQFKNFERVVQIGKDVFHSNKYTYSGKKHGPDDIVTTMLRALNTRSMFLKDPRYSKYHI